MRRSLTSAGDVVLCELHIGIILDRRDSRIGETNLNKYFSQCVATDVFPLVLKAAATVAVAVTVTVEQTPMKK